MPTRAQSGALLDQLETMLSGIRPADAEGCAQRLRALRRKLARSAGRSVESNDELQRIIECVQASAERVQQRRERLPKPTYDPGLPITAHREQILAAIRANQVVILAGETGSGKTTQLPKFCLEAGFGARGLIGCTQPRRIAAQAMAMRVAEELGTELGTAVGYQVRFRQRQGEDGCIKFMTDGILLAEAQQDRRLLAYDTLIIDEAHERSLNIDFLLGYLRRLLPVRPDLKLVITSATIDTERFAAHFGNAPVIQVSGRGYPVEVIYQPLDEAEEGERRAQDLYQGIAEAVRSVDRLDRKSGSAGGAPGDILVFLSGEREIHEARDFLSRQDFRHTEVLGLYARLSAAEQQRVFHPGPARRIILATNVAETSLTVPRIRYVIDSGLARISRYAHRARVQRLPIEPIAQSSAEQRKGRCGRLGPGVCIRLYAEDEFRLRPEFTEPEILRTSLASVVLRMLDMGLGAVEDFPFIDPPAPRMINDAWQLLAELNAVDAGREITPIGRQLARWPLDVRLGRMLVEGARLGSLEDVLVLAAALSIQDPRERPLEAQQAADEKHARFADESSDFVALLKLWQHLRKARQELTGSQFRKLCQREFLSWQRVLEWFDLYQQLRDQAREERLPLTGKHGEFEAVHKALLSGLLSHVCQRHPEERSYLGARNRNFHVFPGSGLFGTAAQWLVAAEIVETTRTYARICARVKPEWIEEQGAHLLKRKHFDPHWSRKRGQVMASEQVSLFGLVLAEKRPVSYARIDPAGARRIFIEAALVRGELDHRAPALQKLMQQNQRLREELERLEHKRRQRDVLADETVLVEFFDARLPADINSSKSFADWLGSLDSAGLAQLQLSRDVLLRENAGQASGERYPEFFLAGGKRLPLTYLFEPGHPADGVTMSLPLELLNTLDPARASWLVPGFLREKVVELMRGLPKPLRRGLTPVPQFADAALAELQGQPAEHLTTWLATTLKGLTGAAVTAGDFNEADLPEHLRLRFCVRDAAGQVLAESRDLAALQARLGQQAQRRFMDRQGQGFNRDGLKAWDFGDLPESQRTASGALAWPALVDQGEAGGLGFAGLRLFDTQEEALAQHGEGVLRLLGLTLAERLGELRRHHGMARSALLAYAPVGDAASLVADLTLHALASTAGDALWTTRRQADFAALSERMRRELGPVFQQQARQLSESLEHWGAARRALDAGFHQRFAAAAADLAAQLQDLVYPGFLQELTPGRLAHFPRYLNGVLKRLERLRQDPARDARLLDQFQPFQQRLEQHLQSGGEYTEALDAYRWLLQEYRISLFAQALGTAEKVSAQRLESAWQAVART